MGNETVSKHICLHRSTEGRFLAGFFLVTSLAATITYAIAIWRNSALVVREGVLNNWGQVLLLVFCVYFLARVTCIAERVLFGSCALISILILVIGNIRVARDLSDLFWRIVLLTLACIAAASATQIVVIRRRESLR